VNSGPAGRDVVVIGASAGGVEALKRLVFLLPAELPAAVLIVLHLSPDGRSVLPDILRRAGTLRVAHARGGETVEHGRVYVAPPDCHLELDGRKIVLSSGPRENGYRPAVDRLFTTAARSCGPGVTGVILSGALDDGTVGLSNIVAVGGAAIIQDPDEALYPGMPANAAAYVPDAQILTLDQIAPAIVRLAGRPVEPRARPRVAIESDQAPAPTSPRDAQVGEMAGITCPECNGVLWESDEHGILRFRCRVGHAYTVESLVASQGVAVEAALWAALRALDERAALAHRLDRRYRANGRQATANRYRRKATEAAEQADVIRQALHELLPQETGVTAHAER
jgi:two-component system, chemotaxis family, protein-glutamate methylesterase/glutaminase